MATEGLSSICAGLGLIEEDESGKPVGYAKGDYCLDNLKDLVRFLRRDDPQTRDVFKQLCKWNIVANDLIPIVEHYQDDRDLVLNAVKVLVFLSMPIDPSSTDINEQLEYLWKLKSVITHSDAIAVVVSLLEGPLENLERDELTEDDRKLVQLVMTLFRNILAVQEISAHQKAEGSANHFLSLRDSFLALLFRENVMDLIILLTQHIGGYQCHLRQDNLLFLDIFHHIFMGQDPEYIAKAGQDLKVNDDAKACIESLRSIMKEEEMKKKVTRLNAISRHSQFSGTFARFSMDGSQALYKGTPASCNVLAKPKIHRGASKRVVWDQKKPPIINNDILVSLHKFLNQFLSGAYNVLMQSIREDIEKEYHAIQHTDVLIFFQLAQFVTSFQYYKSIMAKSHGEADMAESPNGCDDGNTSFKDNICGPIAETLNQSMFELVISKWRYAFECLKETKDYKFLSTAGSLMKIMIRVLDLVLKREPVDSKEHQTACILLYKLFYDQTDQGLTQYLFTLMKLFDAHKQPKSDLAGLVEMIHIILRLMENLQTFGKLRVSRKARRRRKKNDKGGVKNIDEAQANQPAIQNESSENQPAAGQEPAELCNLQTENSGKSGLETETQANQPVIQNGSSVNQPASGQEHAEVCNLQTENSGKSGSVTEIRANQPVIQNEINENHLAAGQEHVEVCNLQTDNPGKSGSDTDLAHNTEGSQFEKQDAAGNVLHVDEGDADHFMDGASNDGSSGDEQIVETDEVDFKLTTLLNSLVGNTTIKNICWLLKFYKSNSPSTNHYIIRMLQRICDDLNLSPMLYELPYLCTFYEILDEQKSCPHKDHKNIVDFLTTLVRRLLRKMGSQPLLFVELLFSKTRRDCHFLNAEFMKRELGDMKNELKNWNDSAEGEASVLPGKKSTARSMADALGDDEFDVTMPSEPYDDDDDISVAAHTETVLDTGKQYVRESGKRSRPLHDDWTDENAEDDIAETSKKDDVERGSKLRRRITFSDEMVEALKGLHEKYKDQKRCAHMIANELSPEGTITAAQISRKLKQLGLHTGKQANEGSMPMTDDDPDNQTLASLKKSDDISVAAQPETVLGTGKQNVRESGKRSRSLHDDWTDENGEDDIAETSKKDDVERGSKLRRRIAFSDEMVEALKGLHEKYKDQKRCAHMIANELSPEGTITAAQVSRKLKQLGLRTGKQANEGSMPMTDDEPDNQTLASLKKRRSKEVNATSPGGELSAGKESDDETLSSMLKKPKKSSKRKEKLSALVQQPFAGNESDHEYPEGSSERNIQTQPTEAEPVNNINRHIDRKSDSPEHETHELFDYQQSDDELADLVDETAPRASASSPIKRRKLRMVIDLEDDEE